MDRSSLRGSFLSRSFPMWIPKWQRDRKKGVDSPMPTEVVSNEELIARPQNNKQTEVEYLIGVVAGDKAKKLGRDRRTCMASSMGMVTAFLASNRDYEPHRHVA